MLNPQMAFHQNPIQVQIRFGGATLCDINCRRGAGLPVNISPFQPFCGKKEEFLNADFRFDNTSRVSFHTDLKIKRVWHLENVAPGPEGFSQFNQ